MKTPSRSAPLTNLSTGRWLLDLRRGYRGASLRAGTLVCGLLSLLSGCGGSGGGYSAPPPPPAPTLVSISLTPNPFSTGVGIARQVTATGTFSDNSTENITSTVTWSSTSGVTVSGGLVTGVTLGAASVTAASGSVFKNLPLTVTSGVWQLAASMSASMPSSAGGPAVLLSNGQVLNFEDSLQPTVYDPAADAWSPTGSFATVQFGPTATLLPNGMVLVAGGAPSGGLTALSSTELYDPSTNAWTAGPSMSTGRIQPTATLLANGQVLVTGGVDNGQGLGGNVFTSSEIYDPAANSWSAAASMVTGHYGHTAVLLANGTVLITAGWVEPCAGCPPQPTGDTEIYDPTANTWTVVGSLNTTRALHAMVLLPSGNVLVSGGLGGTSSTALSSAELYDPATQAWSVTGSLITGRQDHTMTVLPNGSVLVAGGHSGPESAPVIVGSAEVYDPSAGSWSPTGSLNYARADQTATLLQIGIVLVCGGTVQPNSAITDPFGIYQTSCELYW